MTDLLELGAGVHARRHAELDLTTGLVLGSRAALVVDTRGDLAQGRDLHTAVRGITGLPCVVVVTHGHFDHCFGTAAFGPVPVWAHERCPEFLDRTAEQQRAEWVRHYDASGAPDTARALAGTPLIMPDRLVAGSAELDLGGRAVHLLHPGPGHTGHDLAVHVPDAGVLFAGDLFEQGAPPDFEHADPARWPASLGRLLDLRPRVVVPGHGDPAGPADLARQRDELAVLAELHRRVRRGETTTERAVPHSPFPPETTRAALARP
ncbi:MBL fold metallo-hydrolase [Saccharopolyspora sp. HNM0983]|uniref:MBL fold metallo-hydrolase n=1 Tax=Saccharopolyspora montiporae TaxID=2781240 RepID=A0A929G1A8_9PSEU|nr:MBL fold metallo-hydrolase [Saccharopolyspora sp. HNM0983]MBE9374483.1 MBL fold metallo-hydrolase [Saccharopolyspora sp. HNM0983]